MPPKNAEMQKRKTSSKLEPAKRSRVNKQGHFRVTDLRNELPFSEDECAVWFNKYTTDADRSSSVSHDPCIGPDGMERLCQDLQVDPEDIAMLALAWKLNARLMGYFSRSEWLSGMKSLDCDNCEKLKRQLIPLRQLFQNELQFKLIYQFSFDFAKGCGHRNVDIDMGKAMLKLLLEPRWTLLPEFISYLDGSRYKVLNRDQWNNILEFSRTIKADLSNYDVNGAWPVMLDEFVEMYQKNHSMETQADE